MDVFYVQLETGKAAVLHLVDVATSFGAARILTAENCEQIAQALERAWFRPYGNPHMIQCDEARPYCSEEVKLYLERRGIKLQVAPGEAHTRLGIIERRHMVLRTAV